jgi:hypothetical protein
MVACPLWKHFDAIRSQPDGYRYTVQGHKLLAFPLGRKDERASTAGGAPNKSLISTGQMRSQSELMFCRVDVPEQAEVVRL